MAAQKRNIGFLAVDFPIGPSQYPHCQVIWRYDTLFRGHDIGLDNSRKNNFLQMHKCMIFPRLR